MDNNETEKTPKTASKSFMNAGPTLHYSHTNVQRCWLLALAVFIALFPTVLVITLVRGAIAPNMNVVLAVLVGNRFQANNFYEGRGDEVGFRCVRATQ